MSSKRGHKHDGSHKFKTYTEYVKRFSPDKIEASLPEEKKESPPPETTNKESPQQETTNKESPQQETTNKDQQGRTYKEWAITSGLALIVMTTILTLLYAGLVEHWNPVWSLSAIGIITFFGMLIVSSVHQIKVKDSQGTMRRALASSMVVVYLIVFTLIIFGVDFDTLLLDETSKGESPTGLTSSEILDHLTKIILVILGFYFGTKGIKEIVKERAKNSKDTKNSNTQTTVEKIPTTFTPDTPPGIDPPKPIKHTHN